MMRPEELLSSEFPHSALLGGHENASRSHRKYRARNSCGPDWKDDGSLVEAAKETDRAAFEILVGRHERVIFFRALRVTGNHEDAEDVVQ